MSVDAMRAYFNSLVSGAAKVLLYGQDSNGDNQVQGMVGNAAKVITGGSGGTANTDITSWPHTLATHTATGAGTDYNFPSGRSQIQVSSDGAHTGTSTVDIEGSNDNTVWKPMGTLSVTGNSDTASLPTDAPWAYIRSNCTAHGDSTNNVIVTLNV